MDGTDDGEGLNGDRRVSDGDGNDGDSGEEDSTSFYSNGNHNEEEEGGREQQLEKVYDSTRAAKLVVGIVVNGVVYYL